MEEIYEIPQARYARLAARVAKAAARAPKSGLPVPVLSRVSVRMQEFEVHDALAHIRGGHGNRVVSVPMTTVSLKNFSPEVGDWKVVGFRTGFRNVSGKTVIGNSGDVPEAVKGGELCCDHCGYSRKRKHTFIVEKADSGDLVQVGANCIEAFVGFGAGYSSDLVELGSIRREIEEMSGMDVLFTEFLEEEVRTVLAVAYRCVRDEGFVGSSDARAMDTTATWMIVESMLAASRRKDVKAEELGVTAADFLIADDIVAEYGRTEDDFGFRSAVKSSLARGLASLKDVAILTAAAGMHVRDLEREAENARSREIAATSTGVAEPGQRVEFVGKVRNVASFQGKWGERCYVSLFDADGNLMLWKTNGEHGLREGMAYAMKGTVKEHAVCEKGRYSGAVQTVLTRVAVSAELGPATFGTSDGKPVLDEQDADALDMMFPGNSPF